MLKEMINDTRCNILMFLILSILKLAHDPVWLKGVPQVMFHPHVWVCSTISGFHPNYHFFRSLKIVYNTTRAFYWHYDFWALFELSSQVVKNNMR